MTEWKLFALYVFCSLLVMSISFLVNWDALDKQEKAEKKQPDGAIRFLVERKRGRGL